MLHEASFDDLNHFRETVRTAQEDGALISLTKVKDVGSEIVPKGFYTPSQWDRHEEVTRMLVEALEELQTCQGIPYRFSNSHYG